MKIGPSPRPNDAVKVATAPIITYDKYIVKFFPAERKRKFKGDH